MKKIKFVVLILWVLILASCGAGSKKTANISVQKHPNVLFIAIDDLNTWIGCLNDRSGTKTPNLDKLASQGVLFSNAQCQTPLCGPSRASIMSGLRPSTTGIYGMIEDDSIRRPDNLATKDIVFLPEYFRNNGYHTMGIGKLFHHHAPKGVFDESGGRAKGFGPVPAKRFVWDGIGTSKNRKEHFGRTSTDWGAFPSADSLMPDDHSADWAIERLNRNYDKPFLLSVGFLRPHVPLYVPQKWFDMHPLDGIQVAPYKSDDLDDIPSVGLKINDLPMMPSTEWAIKTGQWKNIIQAYLACISFVDSEVGRVLTALENSKYGDNTIIVLWSDHGYRMGEKGTFAKHALWESATNAPLMFVSPKLPKGKVINTPVEMLSIYPTLLDLCGLPAYKRNEGLDLVPTMLSDSIDTSASAITTYGMNNHAIKAKGFRYIRYEDGTEELYNHKIDPNEFDNEAKNTKYNSEIDILKQYLPTVNVKWDRCSSYTFQPYWVEQKERTGK